MKISTSTGIQDFNTVEVNTVEELAQKALKSNISTSVFKDGYRNINNFLYADCIGLDIDNDNKKGTPELSLDQAKRIFSRFKHVILSTRSHNVEKNGIISERFRVILLLSSPISNANDFYCTWYWLKEQFPWIDNQCKDPSRFWYQHKDILSYSEEGALITPIRYSEPEKPIKEGRAVLPGERGELSKQVLQFLEFGVEAGSRNGTVYKVAREFQQALYEYDEAEARIIGSLERNQVLSNDFKEDEAKLAIRSAFTTDAKHAPRLSEIKQRAFHYQRWSDILNEPDKKDDWIIEDLLLRGGTSIMAGVPKVGKTTLVRQLEKSVLRGTPFLGKKTTKGTVLHYSFDEKARTAKRHYVQLGLDHTDDLIIHFGSSSNSTYMDELEEDFLKIKPALVVVDTMFDLIDVQDVNSYGPVKRALSGVAALAERTGTHVLYVHHQNKPNPNFARGGHSILGSTAILGSVDCAMSLEVNKENMHHRDLRIEGRGVQDFGNKVLRFDKKEMVYKVESKTGVDF